MSYHQRTMNIQANPHEAEYRGEGYAYGHRDARHAAAEIAAEADAEIERLTADLAAARAEVERYQKREAHFAKVLRVTDGGQYRADWDSAIEKVLRERDEAIAHKDQVIQTAIETLGRTGHHREMSFDEFVKAGGGECPICLKAEVERLRTALDLFLNRPPGASYHELVVRARAALAALPKEADRE